MELYCEYLETKMKEGMTHIPVYSLSGLDPHDILYTMAQRYSELAFGWDDFELDEGEDDYLGQFLVAENPGPLNQCPECPLPQRIVWSHMRWVQCGEHCDHPPQQCRGGCPCTCLGCAENGFLRDSQDGEYQDAYD